jgi:hypothetical protein
MEVKVNMSLIIYLFSQREVFLGQNSIADKAMATGLIMHLGGQIDIIKKPYWREETKVGKDSLVRLEQVK